MPNFSIDFFKNFTFLFLTEYHKNLTNRSTRNYSLYKILIVSVFCWYWNHTRSMLNIWDLLFLEISECVIFCNFFSLRASQFTEILQDIIQPYSIKLMWQNRYKLIFCNYIVLNKLSDKKKMKNIVWILLYSQF